MVSLEITNQATSLLEAFNTCTLNDPVDDSWYMDTGATSHLAFDIGKLSIILNKNIYSSVVVGNGSVIPTTFRPLHFHNILVTPNIIKNHIFVHKVTKDNKCATEFNQIVFFCEGLPDSPHSS